MPPGTRGTILSPTTFSDQEKIFRLFAMLLGTSIVPQGGSTVVYLADTLNRAMDSPETQTCETGMEGLGWYIVFPSTTSSLPGECHTETYDATDGQCSGATYYCHANQTLFLHLLVDIDLEFLGLVVSGLNGQ